VRLFSHDLVDLTSLKITRLIVKKNSKEKLRRKQKRNKGVGNEKKKKEKRKGDELQ